MKFLSCKNPDCRTIVAIDPRRVRISKCPRCKKPLEELAVGAGPPMGYDKRKIDPIVKKYGGAHWRVDVQVLENVQRD
jgi:hypothetical protein